ncbi:hypothetical protein FQN52_003446 [Onygenales sp. PD_12]|nr:hypothetical protein FQN52_003446 [Onygenales sp. PD_12]
MDSPKDPAEQLAARKTPSQQSLHDPPEQYDMDEVEGGTNYTDDTNAIPLRGHTKNDRKDMGRMGKRQELIRAYRPLSALSFALILQATWEFMLISHTEGLFNGGLAGLFWSYLWTFIGFSFVIFSLAEMASMAPISGGQYHWVSEFAPPKHQKFLSYVTGWLSVLAWQAGAASGSFLTGTIIQGLITVNSPSYKPTAWQGTLLVFAMVALIYVFNIWVAQGLPMIQNLLLVVHVFGFIAVVVVLWAMAPHQTAKAVFTEFRNGGHWPNIAVSLMVGQISAIYGSLSADATAHMAEEVKDAGRNVPNAISWGYIINGILALVFMVSYIFAIPSVEDALEDPSGFPFIYVFRNAVSVSGVNALTVIVLVLVIASNISFNASASRQTFSFARDKGLPFARWLSAVHPTKHIPANAILISCVISALLSLINLGSSAAFHAIISLNVAALMSTYAISISCVLHARLTHPERLPHARWSLGPTLGPIFNAISLAYVVFALFWSFWPGETPVVLDDFNWSVVIFLGVLALSLLMYYVQGRKTYTGPVTSVTGRH